ncbi:DNA cytosine methyltransferase [Alteromonas sp. NFXS44]|uniref:DNA cytosine methyltransferase n=1 Tax=Alteromonas sp. NFXS44 TaxID=2818435 RepID=UPI0032DF20A0
MRTFYEFFSGGGMARAGLGENWECLFANDFSQKKVDTYIANWGDKDIVCDDVSNITTHQLEGQADLAWASFPCQDLSLAGSGAGLSGERSGTFWGFWKLITSLRRENRAPKVVILENVCGALTSHEGKDFAAICSALNEAEYNFGAIIIDAINFLPQSRPRLFIIATDTSVDLDKSILSESFDPVWHSKSIVSAFNKLPIEQKPKWKWWNLPHPQERRLSFADIIEKDPKSVKWHSEEETQKIMGMMSDLHIKKVRSAQASGDLKVGSIYKRTRPDGHGGRIQRAEIRFDDVAGCLRTPSGGSSRQLIMIVEGSKIRTRLLSTREAARLMGLPEQYKLPEKYNEAYHLAGDGVAVPVVEYLSKNIVEKLIPLSRNRKAA